MLSVIPEWKSDRWTDVRAALGFRHMNAGKSHVKMFEAHVEISFRCDKMFYATLVIYICLYS